MNKFILGFSVVLLLFSLEVIAQTGKGMSAGEIQQSLKKLRTLGSVLYVAAHPDDENTRLLSYLANERNFRTVYISMTRGDGGQNLIGKEQGEDLGLIRTRELLEARKIDGAEQFFTRANDFGYSKNPEETFSMWNKDSILADVVWAIRKFQPDVIINRFPTNGDGGHGHHTASAILAVEAFSAAADPKRFPEQLKQVTTWQAKRIFHNSFIPRGQPQQDFSAHLKLDVGGYNPLLGVSYGEMAAASRSMHKSQGFGVASTRGTTWEYFKKLAGDTVVSELFEGINTNWSRVKNGNTLDLLIAETERKFEPLHPEKSVAALVEILKLLQQLENHYWRDVKIVEVKKLIAACAGLWFEANAKDYAGIPGDTITVMLSVIPRSLPGVVLQKVSVQQWDSTITASLKQNELFNISKTIQLNRDSRYANPYWLDNKHEQGMYRVGNQDLRGKPWNDPELQAEFMITINGQPLTFQVPVTHKWTDPVKGEQHRPFEMVPAVSLTPSDALMIFTGSERKSFRVQVQSMTDSINGFIRVIAPAGWVVSPSIVPVVIKGKGNKHFVEYIVHPTGDKMPAGDGNPSLEIVFESGNDRYDQQVIRINYDHIPPLVKLTKSSVKLVMLQLQSPAKKIGYIEGAGDDVTRCLKLAGFDVTVLDEQKILKESLSQFDAIITGIRAYNTIENMDAFYQPLMNYIEAGGNLIVQYNTSNFLSSINSDIGPYPFKITRDRVTEENASVQFNDPSHFLLNSPNKISQDDFSGWIQERGLYFAGDWSPEYKTVLQMNDRGEKPNGGNTIITKKGEGYFIYTGISFFRQLPAGVPGAYRLFVNMINAGK